MPSTIQRVVSAVEIGEAMTVAARTVAAMTVAARTVAARSAPASGRAARARGATARDRAWGVREARRRAQVGTPRWDAFCRVTPDFRWLDASVFDGAGSPKHTRGVTNEVGIDVVGLPWLNTWGSGRFCAVGRDAEHVVQVIRKRLGAERFALTFAV